MSSRRTELSHRAVRWVLPGALVALAPKCLLCVAAYAGVGVGLGFSGPEICGPSAGLPGSWVSSLAWLGAAGGLGSIGFLARCHACRLRPSAIKLVADWSRGEVER